MESFTYMSDEAIYAMIRNQRNNDEPFTFTLNAREFNNFRKALDTVSLDHPNSEFSSWAELFTNSIASPEFALTGETFENVVYALRFVWFNASLVHNDFPEVASWCGDFLSSMAEALDVEFV